MLPFSAAHLIILSFLCFNASRCPVTEPGVAPQAMLEWMQVMSIYLEKDTR